jgi:hypothetical protein
MRSFWHAWKAVEQRVALQELVDALCLDSANEALELCRDHGITTEVSSVMSREYRQKYVK